MKRSGISATVLSIILGASSASRAQPQPPEAPPPAPEESPPPAAGEESPPPPAAPDAPPEQVPEGQPPSAPPSAPGGPATAPPNVPPGAYPYPPPYYPPYPYRYPVRRPPEPPRRLPYREGVPAPPGYRLKEGIHRGLVIGGAVTLGSTWLLSAITAGIVQSNANDDAFIPLFVPLAGPFITMGTADANTLGSFVLAIDGLAQVTSLGMLIAGVIYPKYEWVLPYAGLELSPIVTAETTGIGARGTF